MLGLFPKILINITLNIPTKISTISKEGPIMTSIIVREEEEIESITIGMGIIMSTKTLGKTNQEDQIANTKPTDQIIVPTCLKGSPIVKMNTILIEHTIEPFIEIGKTINTSQSWTEKELKLSLYLFTLFSPTSKEIL